MRKICALILEQSPDRPQCVWCASALWRKRCGDRHGHDNIMESNTFVGNGIAGTCGIRLIN